MSTNRLPHLIAAVVSAAGSAAMFFALYKILPLSFRTLLLAIIAGAGAVTFLFSNLLGLRQHNGEADARILVRRADGAAHRGSRFRPPYALSHSLLTDYRRRAVREPSARQGGAVLVHRARPLTTVDDYRGAIRHPVTAAVFGVLVLLTHRSSAVSRFLGEVGAREAAALEGRIVWLLFLFAGSVFEALYLLAGSWLFMGRLARSRRALPLPGGFAGAVRCRPRQSLLFGRVRLCGCCRITGRFRDCRLAGLAGATLSRARPSRRGARHSACFSSFSSGRSLRLWLQGSSLSGGASYLRFLLLPVRRGVRSLLLDPLPLIVRGIPRMAILGGRFLARLSLAPGSSASVLRALSSRAA